MRNSTTVLSDNTTAELEVPHQDSTPCLLCRRSTAPFTVQRSALLDTLTLLIDVAAEVHDADGRQLLLAIALDARRAAEEVAL